MQMDVGADQPMQPGQTGKCQSVRNNRGEIVDLVAINMYVDAIARGLDEIDPDRSTEAYRMNLAIMIGKLGREVIIEKFAPWQIAIHKSYCLAIASQIEPATAGAARGCPVPQLLTIAENLPVERSHDFQVKVVDVESPMPHDRRLESALASRCEQTPKLTPKVFDAGRRVATPK